MENTYEVKGMSCVICKNAVETGIKRLNGVKDCKVNLLENEATITFDESKINIETIRKAVADLGYELIIHSKNEINYTKIKMIASVILVIILMCLSMGHMIGLPNVPYSKYYQLLLCTLIIVLNYKYYKSGYKALIKLNPNMDSLVFLSSCISYIYSLIALFNSNFNLYFETSAMVLVVVSIGKYIEGQNKKKTTKTIRGLATLIPMQANLVVDNKIQIIPIDDLKVDDIVEVKPGESIPQDGVVVLGTSNIDESMITGESMPQTKNINDNVIGGTVNINGVIRVRITVRNTQTTISKIISLTKQATMSKIPVERFVDAVSRYFVFAVIAIALLTFTIWIILTKNIELSLNFALSVLVISCPCALGLATPSAIMVATGACARNGVLIKNPEVLEIAYKIKNIILDKTGTLTKNKLEVIDIKEFDPSFLNVLSSLEKNTNHPIGKTIIEKYPNGNIEFDSFEQISSEGIVGRKDNEIYFAGNRKLCDKYIHLNEDYDSNYSCVYVGNNNKLLGIVFVGDVLRQTSFTAIESFKKRNINPIMCTGDNEKVAKNIANKLGIDNYLSSVTPADKNTLILEKKKDGVVAMVGDGINDAIALSSADVSFTISKSTDIAYATSDIVLMSNSVNDVAFFVDISRKTMRIIKQNLFWALFYNSIFIPLASGILYKPYGIALNPMIGAATMCISSIFVLTNALRINSIKKEEIRIMNKTVTIEGMMCNNCVRHAEEALKALGADVKVVLDEKKAYITNTSLTDEQIKLAIEQAGYSVSEIVNG